MLPNISQEIVLQLKNLKPGNCIAFGSAFKVPTSLYIDEPNPQPLSNNVNLEDVWFREEEVENKPPQPQQVDVHEIMNNQKQTTGPQFAQNQDQKPNLIQPVSNLV